MPSLPVDRYGSDDDSNESPSESKSTPNLPVQSARSILDGQVSVLPPALSASFDANSILKALQHHWLLAVTLGVLFGSIAGAAVWFFLPPGKVTAEVRLHVDSITPGVLITNNVNNTEFQNYERTQAAQVKSRLVLNRALDVKDVKYHVIGGKELVIEYEKEVGYLDLIKEREALNDDPIEWLDRELAVDTKLAPEIMRITLMGNRAKELELKQIVNAVASSFLEEIIDNEKKSKHKRLEDLKGILERLLPEVKKKRLEIRNKKFVSADSQSLAIQQHLQQEKLGLIQKELFEIQSKLRKLDIEHPKSDENGGTSSPSDHVATSQLNALVEAEPAFQKLKQEKDKLDATLRSASAVTVDGEKGAAYLKGIKNKINQKQQEMDDLSKELRPRITKEIKEKSRAADNSNETQRALLQTLKGQLTNDLEKESNKANNTNTAFNDFEDLKDDLSKLEELTKKISNQVDTLTVEIQAPSRINLLDSAFVTHPDETKRRIIAAATATLLVAFIIMMAIGWWEYRFRRVYSPEVVQGLGLRLMGTVPALPSRRQLQQLTSNDSSNSLWQSLLTESVDTARTMLLHAARTDSLRIVMVTSAMGGEGKTSLSCHLASSLARAGRKTLLMDCDLRNPAVHRLFDIPRAPGMCELLRGDASLSDVIQQLPTTGLWTISGGECNNLAIKALAQDGFREIAAVLNDFDFIVVDSAPVLPVADSLLIAPYVDAVIFSIMHNVSQLHKVYAAQQRLDLLGVRLLGAVVNGTAHESYGSNYRYVTA
jgi:capsular exopolysaccharide synthesis family protein